MVSSAPARFPMLPEIYAPAEELWRARAGPLPPEGGKRHLRCSEEEEASGRRKGFGCRWRYRTWRRAAIIASLRLL